MKLGRWFLAEDMIFWMILSNMLFGRSVLLKFFFDC